MDNYSIRLDRPGGIHPGDIPASKLAALIAAFAEVMGNADDLHLTGMADNCVRLDFSFTSPEVRAAATTLAALAIGTTVQVSDKMAERLAELDRVRERDFPNVSITLPDFDEVKSAVIRSDTKLAKGISKHQNLQYSTTIYGKLMDVGGESPNLHIRQLGSNSEVIADCTEEIAAEAAPLLYSIIGVEGTATKGGIDGVRRMRVSAILPYRQSDENPFDKLREMGYATHFKKLGMSVDEYMQWVRGNKDEETDDAEG